MKRRRRRGDAGGFTLLEVLIALLLGMIGLLGTVAVQQTVINATQNANDAAIALRLATQTVEEFNVRTTVAHFTPVATGAWSAMEFLDANGRRFGAATPAARWTRQWRVVDLGVGLPYNISVQVGYNMDSSAPKLVRLDIERRK